MATTIDAPRSPVVPTRRRRFNIEKWGWLYMRFSGVLLVVLIFGHLLVNLFLGDGVKAIDFLSIGTRIQRLMFWVAIVLWLLLLAGFVPRQLMHIFGGE